MSDLHLPDSLTERIQAIAERENRSVEDVVARMLQHYPTLPDAPQEEKTNLDPLLGLIGLLDDEIQDADLSSTVRETLAQHTHPKYGWTKRDRSD